MSSSLTSIPNKAQGGVQSLEVGLTVLDVLIDHNEPMMLKEIAQAIDMHPAKVHRYLVSLIRKDYAKQIEDGRYALGNRVNALSYSGLNQNNLLQHLTRAATDIKNAMQCSVQIAKWFQDGPVVIQSIESDSPISIITRVGSRMPLTTSATGRLFASLQDKNIIKALVNAEWLQVDANADLDLKWQQYEQMLTTIRHQGYATVTGDMLMGISAISIPVNPVLNGVAGSDSGQVQYTEYALTVIGTTQQLPEAQNHNRAEDIRRLIRKHLPN
ncbi:IclR family transcriptional regulator [Psychrobacter sp. UBA3962]|uniref:IclR family transcriptional regulator n=1 Tax=Psychrobacter sp. UBA3962 TaxID=1947352 RepID=UPI0025EA26C1|nr:IclR family transcriptional regulator [Psychrobacter sp. UBA3962]